MGKSILLVIVGFMLLFAIMSVNLGKTNVGSTKNMVDRYSDEVVRNIANSGMQYARNQLALNWRTWRGVTGMQFANGSFDVSVADTIIVSDSLKNIVCTATFMGKNYSVRAVLRQRNGGVPPAMTYAVLSGGGLELEGNILIQDDNNPNLNANVHTNDELEIHGNSVLVKGFGSYVTHAEASPPDALTSTFQPNVNPDGLPVVSQKSLVDVPHFRADDYLSLADTIVSGNLTLSGNISLGTRENPKIWYIGGKLRISGNVSGYGAFIVKGEIEVNGNVTINAPPGESTLGLYSESEVEIDGNVTVAAQILANEGVEMQGNSKLYGNIVSGGEVELEGNVNIYYRPASSALTQPFWSIPDKRPIVDSYFE